MAHDLSDAELLAQSIALPLLNHAVVQASRRHAPGVRWRPLLNGLYLWQVWDMALPLSAWRDEVVKWIYHDRPTTTLRLPAHYPALCTAHKLWMSSPVQIHIPLRCVDQAHEEAYSTFLKISRWYSLDPPTRLKQLALPVRADAYPEGVTVPRQADNTDQPIALAMLMDYAVVTYGRERLPVLVASLGQHTTWDTLLLAVFGVSAAEFETGWQAHLAALLDQTSDTPYAQPLMRANPRDDHPIGDISSP